MDILLRGKGVSIHRNDCKNIISLENNERDKIIEVAWGKENKDKYIADIEIKAEDRLGILTWCYRNFRQCKDKYFIDKCYYK